MSVLFVSVTGCDRADNSSPAAVDAPVDSVSVNINPAVREYCTALRKYANDAQAATALREYALLDSRDLEKWGKDTTELTQADRDSLKVTILETYPAIMLHYYDLCLDAYMQVGEQIVEFEHTFTPAAVDSVLAGSTTLAQAVRGIKRQAYRQL